MTALNSQGLAINMVVYAELAGKAFYQYRQHGGQKSGVVPDFFIGAQAVCEGHRLLTRDAGRYKTYFPKIKLISP